MKFENFVAQSLFRYSHKDNLLLNESAEEAVIHSVNNFKKAGGGCLVENSTFGLNRRTAFLKQLSEETGVHIIAGTGLYLNNMELDSRVAEFLTIFEFQGAHPTTCSSML